MVETPPNLLPSHPWSALISHFWLLKCLSEHGYDFTCVRSSPVLVNATGSNSPHLYVAISPQHKFWDEIVHTMSYLQVQQKRQLSGMEEFWSVRVVKPSKGVDVWVCAFNSLHRTLLLCKHSQQLV